MYVLAIVISLFGAGTIFEIEIPGFYNEGHCQAIAHDITVDKDKDAAFFHVYYTCKPAHN